MADETNKKIKLLRCKLGEFIKVKQEFANVDKSLKDSEMYLNLRIKELDEDYQKIKVMHDEILKEGEDSSEAFERYIVDNVFETIQKIYFAHSTNLHELLKIVCLSDRHDLTFTEFSQSSFQRLNINNPNKSASEMLNLSYLHSSITPFDGTYDQWPEFKDQYISNIHENHNFNDCAKLRLLQSLLKGDALKVIKREFENLKSADYEAVWDKLNKRYNHKRSLVNSYFHILFSQPIIDKETSSNLKNLYDITFDTLLALKRLGLKTDEWGDIVLYLVQSKLPMKTKELWDEKISFSDSLPSFNKFMDFLEKRFRILESLEVTRKGFNSKTTSSSKNPTTMQTTQISKPISRPKFENYKHLCKVCNKGVHAIRKCFKFQKMNVPERINIISTLGYCSNCLSFSHKINQCTSTNRCTCGQNHHSLLHPTKDHENTEQNKIQSIPQNQISNQFFPIASTSDGRFGSQEQNVSRTYISTLINNADSPQSVIFPTAVVKVTDQRGQCIQLRAVIDACSDVSYITKSAARRLHLQVEKSEIQTVGLGDVITADCKKIVYFVLGSRVDPIFSKPMRAYVMDTISSNRPVNNFKREIVLDSRLILADPSYNVNSKIDLLLGGEIDSVIKLHGLIKSQDENICYQETTLGWVVSGSVAQSSCFLSLKKEHDSNFITCTCGLEVLNKSLQNFWNIEDITVNSSPLTEEEKLCEEIYEATTIRIPSGKYCVSLPFKNKIDGFSDMRKIALNRFFMLEKKLSKNVDLKYQYVQCIREYSSLNHMREVDPNDYPCSYYIPHHAVIKETSSTTRLRVVFDASAKDASLRSLNENLLNGPRLQLELLDLLIQFRFYKIAFTADIEKMYRQININPNDERFQLILWRENPDQPLKTFALGTVTFGTTSAPYLAVKTLQRLSEDEKLTYPLGSECLKNGFYVDDCIFGADSLQKALEIQSQTLDILKTAGFHLRKWSSNRQELLENVPECDRETKTTLEFDNKFSVKTLGIHWFPKDDLFYFTVKLVDHTIHTKRSILSDIAKIFDPLGWVSPCVVSVKLLIQKLWMDNKNWDDPLSDELSMYWQNLRKSLLELSDIKIPRWLFTFNQSKIEIHGFADASQKAYAAAVYLKTVDGDQIHSNLIFSKTKVAPLKTVSLPRLELMAAVMLAKMIDHLRSHLKIENVSFHYWSDSKIALAWIKDDPHKRAVFVSHRVSEIQGISHVSEWSYVNTSENPADLGTRGIVPSQLVKSDMWWHGPKFLQTLESVQVKTQADENVILPSEDNAKVKSLKTEPILHNFLSRRKSNMVEISSNIMKFEFHELNKYSTLNKLIRVVAYCLRFKKINRKTHIHISPTEYENSLNVVLRLVQTEVFCEEIESLESGINISKSSQLFCLNPFINSTDKLLRVSGRLGNASHLNYDQKFPIILPRNHVISRLIVQHAHLSSIHGTHQETIILICQRYHIIRCKSLVKFIINHCIRCFRIKCTTQKQQMGLLPELRVTPNRPFLNSGVDFAGPFQIKRFKGRCNTHYKSYFALFICFSTKAIHLEVVIDLSTSSFIAAFRRFIARRGLVKNLHSDCGTNFIGANKRITRSMKDVESEWSKEMAQELFEFHTQWHYNPPGAPHFGGLWESGVKSVKHHLKRIIGETRFTYDEFETLLLQVESILNSRPLGQISNNFDSVILTPAHFLIQDSLLSMPDNNLLDAQISTSDKWSTIQKIVQTFWKIWSNEYLNTLRQRKKWHTSRENIKENDIVLVKDNNLPPNSWMKGIVTKVHPGLDGLVRVVTVKTKSNTFQRPIVKICPLPILK